MLASPLADRMRPCSMAEFVGQEHLLASGAMLRVMLEKGELVSLILWGPPGTGKTTLARLLAQACKAEFIQLSAVTSGIADVREVIALAQHNQLCDKRTILFVDELHRFNKAQQDAFLPHVEKGTIIFIGATTENPSFEVIAPLLSRCRVVRLRGLNRENLGNLVSRALRDKERGLGGRKIKLKADALEALIRGSGGDARVMLNALELAASFIQDGQAIEAGHVSEALQSKAVLYDQEGEEHYNTISAFIKSMRGSDENATLYYLTRMMEGGEDPLFIARRMVIFASEDVGLADFRALLVAVAAFQACERVGYPECQLTLTHCALTLARAQKSRVVVNAMGRAQETLANTRDVAIPLHLRNPVTDVMKKEGYGEGYSWQKRPGIVDAKKSFLPEELRDVDFFKD